MSEAGQGGALLTIFLKHRQSMNLAEINEKLDQTGVWRDFPPEGVEVVSWYVMMGTGRVVTDKLREVNLAIERCAWARSRPGFTPPTTSARSGRA
jgi:hypothetical protein